MSSEKNYLNENYKSFFEDSLSKADPELYKATSDELKRQQQHIELIASENIVSQAVLEAQGSVLTNKYAEGYPGKRYYNGCEHEFASLHSFCRACVSDAATACRCSSPSPSPWARTPGWATLMRLVRLVLTRPVVPMWRCLQSCCNGWSRRACRGRRDGRKG